MQKLTLDWCRKNLQDRGYDTSESSTAVEFRIAKCENGSDAIVAFNTFRKWEHDNPRVFVSNFYVERIKSVQDLKQLVDALGFGGNAPWTEICEENAV